MTRIIVADDHPVVRQGIIKILAPDTNVQVVGEAGNAGEVLSLLDRIPADVLLLDIAMPGRNGLDLLPELGQKFPRLQILILSQYPEEQMAVRAIRAGANGYLTKDSAPTELANAIRRLREGRKYVTPSLAELLAETIQVPTEKPHQTLSDREYQVFLLLASGKTVSEIAERFNLSVKTVSTYRTRVLEKMGLRTNVELTRYAFENNISL